MLGIPHIGLRQRAAKIMKDVDAPARLLDAGSGTGVYSFTLSKKVRQINAIDNEKEKIDYTRAVNHFENLSFDLMDLTDLNFADETFDLVICSDVIEHIHDDRRAFSELSRVSKKGAIILLTVPFDSEGNRRGEYESLGHERPGYTAENIEDLCNKNGLRILETKKYSYEIAGRLLHINYKLVERRMLLWMLFYPLYSLALATDFIFKVGEPTGIYFKITKS